jgi:hypothetical protein
MHIALLEEAVVQLLQNFRAMNDSLCQINKNIYVIQSRGVDIRFPDMIQTAPPPVDKVPMKKLLTAETKAPLWKSGRIKAKVNT